MFGRRCLLLSALMALLLVCSHARGDGMPGGRRLNQFGGLRGNLPFLHQSNTASKSTQSSSSGAQPSTTGLPFFRPPFSGGASSTPATSGRQPSSSSGVLPISAGLPFFRPPFTGGSSSTQGTTGGQPSSGSTGSSSGVLPISAGLPIVRPPFTGGSSSTQGTTGGQPSSGSTGSSSGVLPISAGLPFLRPPFTGGSSSTQGTSSGSSPTPAPQPSSGMTGSTGTSSIFAQRLQGLVKPMAAAAGRFQRRDIPLTSTISQSLARSIATGSATAAASAMSTAISSNPLEAAQGWLSAAASAASSAGGFSGQRGIAVAEAFAQAVVFNPSRAGQMYARSAALAVSSGNTEAFASAVAQSFSVVSRRGHMPQFVQAVATAITQSGDQGQYAYGMAIARAVAAGGDSQAAVAEATATVFCTGGSTATAWASAYAVSLTINPQGCLVLNQARAIAVARCNGGVFTAQSFASATSTVLGYCGLSNGSGFQGGNFQLFGQDVPSTDPSSFGFQGTDYSGSDDGLQGFGN